MSTTRYALFQALQERVERLFAAMLESGPRPPAGPPRGELLALLDEAARGALVGDEVRARAGTPWPATG